MNFLNTVFVICLVFLGTVLLIENQRIDTMTTKINSISENEDSSSFRRDLDLAKGIMIVNGQAESREHALQDSLEQRIGDLEHKVDNIENTLWSKKRR